MKYLNVLFIFLVAFSTSALAQDEATKVKKLLGYFQYLLENLLEDFTDNYLPYAFDEANHILDGDGMFQAPGGNFISLGHSGGVSEDNVNYNSSNSIDGIYWENNKQPPFIHVQHVSNAHDTSITEFNLKVTSTLNGIPIEQEVTTLAAPPGVPLPCPITVITVDFKISDDLPSFSYAFLWFSETVGVLEPSPTTVVELAPSTNEFIEATFKVSVDPGVEFKGMLVYTLFAKTPRNARTTASPGGSTDSPIDPLSAILSAISFPCSLINDVANGDCVNGFPVFTNIATPPECQCIDGFEGGDCSTETTGGGDGGGGLSPTC